MIRKLLGAGTTRSLAVVSILRQAKRAFDRGKRLRAVLLLGLAVLAWKWAVIALVAQGLVSLLRGGRSSGGDADSSPA